MELPLPVRDDHALPEYIQVEDNVNLRQQKVWLCIPMSIPNVSEVSEKNAESSTKYYRSYSKIH